MKKINLRSVRVACVSTLTAAAFTIAPTTFADDSTTCVAPVQINVCDADDFLCNFAFFWTSAFSSVGSSWDYYCGEN